MSATISIGHIKVMKQLQPLIGTLGVSVGVSQ